MAARSAPANVSSLGRYTVYGEIAAGGMARILYGQLTGPGGFSRAVAIKRLHPQFAKDESFVAMFLDEARLSARIAHANVVQTLDVLSDPDELSVVMEYVQGESLASLLGQVAAQGETIPEAIAVSLMVGVLHGLHAAHETHGEHGEPLHIIHRDVSPENILVGADGVARLIDFGVARAQGRSRATPAGQLKGKLAYMACEQFRGQEVDRRVDVYGASVVLWEALTGRMLFSADNDAALVSAVLTAPVEPPSAIVPGLSEALDRIVLKGLARERTQRFASAREMALALERELGLATQSIVSDWLEHVAGEALEKRARALREMRAAAAPGEADEGQVGTRTRPIDLGRALAAQAATEVAPPQQSAGSQVSRSGWRAKPSSQRTWGLGLALALSAAAAGAWQLGTARPPAAPPEAAAPLPPAQGPGATQRGKVSAASAAPPAEPTAPSRERVEPPPAPANPPSHAQPAPPPSPRDAAPPAPAPAIETRAEAKRPTLLRPRQRAARRERSLDKPRTNAPVAPSQGVDCTSPFTVDALGIRHVKPACLDERERSP